MIDPKLPHWVLLFIVSGVFLYGVFAFADWAAKRWFEFGNEYIEILLN